MSTHSIQRILLAAALIAGMASIASPAAEARSSSGTAGPAKTAKASTDVRDHRAPVVSRDVRDHRAPVVSPSVRDHRSAAGVTVRKVGRGAASTPRGSEDKVRSNSGTVGPAKTAKANTDVRDHRAPVASPDVRDHRAPVVSPDVRDHRSTAGVAVRKVGRGAVATLRGSEDKVQSTGTKFTKPCARLRCHRH